MKLLNEPKTSIPENKPEGSHIHSTLMAQKKILCKHPVHPAPQGICTLNQHSENWGWQHQGGPIRQKRNEQLSLEGNPVPRAHLYSI